jgi:hypothetical protein
LKVKEKQIKAMVLFSTQSFPGITLIRPFFVTGMIFTLPTRRSRPIRVCQSGIRVT